MRKRILAIALMGVAGAMLAACGGIKAADKEAFCEATVGKTSGKPCDCAIKAVTQNYGGKANDFVRYSVSDLSRDERRKVEKSLEDVKVSAAKNFAQDMMGCVTGR